MVRERILTFAVAFLLLSSMATVFGENSSDYYKEGNASGEQTISLDGENIDTSISIKYPATEVLDAKIGLEGVANSDGNYPEGISVEVKNYEWKYEGSGYGALGNQQKFGTNSISASAKFAESGEEEVIIRLPTNSTVADASMEISGLPYGSGDLDEYYKASVDTNGGSMSSAGSASMVGDNYYVVWEDNGDLVDYDTSIDSIKFRAYVDGSWSDIALMESNFGNTDIILSEPLVVANDDFVVVAWNKNTYPGDEELMASYSTDEGESWSSAQSIDPAYNHYIIYDFDGAVSDDGTIHVVWSSVKEGGDEYHIYYQKSEDSGESWDEEILISDADSSSSIGAQIAVNGNNVHITWEQYYSSQSYYAAEYARSTNGGETFGSPGTVSSSGNTVSETAISAQGSNVVIGWLEDSDSGDVLKSKTSSNTGSTFGTETIVATSDAGSYAFLSSDNDGGANYYFSWLEIPVSGQREVFSARSANSGSTWNSPVNVDGIDNGDENQFRASSVVEANSDRVFVLWSEENSDSGASSDLDIVYSVSTNDGSTWADFDDVSEYYYEADSGAPALAYASDYLYLVYIDNGDYDQEDSNGCDQNSRDGDIFFTRSDDGGENWEELEILSKVNADQETDLDGPLQTAQHRTDITASGSDVHVVWNDHDTWDGLGHIYVTSSSNNGEDWNTPEAIFTDTGGPTYGVTIDSNGDNVVIAWNTNSGDIYSVYSTNGGNSWSDAVLVDDGTNLYYMPEILYNEGKFHLVWSDNTYLESVYYTSSSNGASWLDSIFINPEDAYSYSYSPVITADGSKLFVAWVDNGDYDGDSSSDYDIVWSVSNDNGETWEDVEIVIDTDTSTTLLLPSLASGSGFTYVTYQYYTGGSYDYYFAFSQDGGGSWSESYEITNYDDSELSAKYYKMDMLIGDKTYFAFPEETDISGGDRDDVNVYVRSTLSDDYPEDPYVKITGNKNWEWAGELNRDNSPQEWEDTLDSPGASKSFKDALNEALQSAIDNEETIVDEYGVEMTEIQMTVGSSSKGTVGFSNLNIEYDTVVYIQTEQLISALNRVIESSDDNEAEAILKINSMTPGKLKLTDLLVTTTDADLSLTDLSFSGDFKEGGDVIISAIIENDGEGDAVVTVEFRNGDELIATSNVEGVTGGSSKSVTTTWKDVPEGTHSITVEIVDSLPADSSQGSEDSLTQSLIIEGASPEIAYNLEFTDLLVEGIENSWTLEITNEGEKYGEISTTLYWDENDEDNIIEIIPQTKVDVDETKTFEGDISPTSQVEKLFILVEDSSEGILYDEEIDIEIKKLPNLEITKIEWEDEGGNIVNSFSDGSVANAKIYVMNKGSFDVNANLEISVTKSGKDLQQNFGGILDNYGSVTFPGNQETIVTFNGKYPSVSFLSGGKADFTGFWSVELSIKNIVAVNPNEEFWDSENLVFSDSKNRVEISTPPSLGIVSFTSNSMDANQGDTLTLTVVVSNEGGASASGNINLLELGVLKSVNDFTVDGFGTQQIQVSHTLPAEYDGEIRLKVVIDRSSVVPTVGQQDVLTDDSSSILINVKGTLKESSSSSGESSGDTGNTLVIAGAGGLVLVGVGAGYFFYSRSKSGLDDSDPFGGVPEQQPPAMAPPVPEQPPAMAPPVPEQPPAMAPPVPEQPPAMAPPVPEQPPAMAPP
ncbi:MAG: hypothetical protein CMB06_00585, partial [Euryarchaeota archaeon]|nr:hypothetical protein [Euryarchaeota archaeon]